MGLVVTFVIIIIIAGLLRVDGQAMTLPIGLGGGGWRLRNLPVPKISKQNNCSSWIASNKDLGLKFLDKMVVLFDLWAVQHSLQSGHELASSPRGNKIRVTPS
jgi:hypothetical protein